MTSGWIDPLIAPEFSRSRAARLAGLLAWGVLCFATAALGAVASIEAASFYLQLARPAWAPPGWLFGPVWTLLYAMMALSAWLAWLRPPSPRRNAGLLLFVAQLVANALWSWLFFAWHRGAFAAAEVLVLWALIAATIVAFLPVRRAAALLLVPYLAWVSFASVLTWAVWLANPAQLG
jgi:tryptophan-rich sensory protein